MGKKRVTGAQEALLLFADVIDSSRFSAVLDYEAYARRLVSFQEKFERLGKRYFPDPKDKTKSYTQVDARGDEGTVFVIDTDLKPTQLVFRAIEFLYHLKGQLKFSTKTMGDNGEAPSQIEVGAGVHFGKVAYTTEIRENHSVISGIEGFSINFAKRVESSSRDGKHSHVMLSEKAFRFAENEPAIFIPVTTEMKGIHKNVEVYEVRSGLFDNLMLDGSTDPSDAKLMEQANDLASNPVTIDEPWVKSLVLSVLDVLLKKSPIPTRRSEYKEKQLKLAWHSPTEDDPILLYLRARHFSEAKKYTQQLRYLQKIAQTHPQFMHARKKMVEACWQIAKNKPERAELVFARDVAIEFLERFEYLLTPEEKKQYNQFVKEAASA